MGTMEQILNLARWAPSGDNTQPWRFEIRGKLEAVIHGFDTRSHCVYDLDGRPSQMALGALLETLSIAASDRCLRADLMPLPASCEDRPLIHVRLVPDGSIPASPLAPFITARTVQRRAMHVTPLTAPQKTALLGSTGGNYELIWFEDLPQRLKVARLLFRNAALRLTMREAWEVHSRVIEWHARYSTDRIPDQAVCLDPVSTWLMRWVMKDWRRVQFFNTWLAGTLLPRLELDLIPALACAAHMALVAAQAPVNMADYIAAGRAMQGLWLEATRQGLQLQPEMTPVIFSRYCREGRAFTRDARAQRLAGTVAGEYGGLIAPVDAARVVFFARIGTGRKPGARSTRLPLASLTLPGTTVQAMIQPGTRPGDPACFP